MGAFQERRRLNELPDVSPGLHRGKGQPGSFSSPHTGEGQGEGSQPQAHDKVSLGTGPGSPRPCTSGLQNRERGHLCGSPPVRAPRCTLSTNTATCLSCCILEFSVAFSSFALYSISVSEL